MSNDGKGQQEQCEFPPWPASWPGQRVVSLDNLGDPGFWMEKVIPDVEEALSGTSEDDDALAGELAEEYIRAAGELDFPLPSDFGATVEDTRRMVKDDFRGFIGEWRKRFRSMVSMAMPPDAADPTTQAGA